MKTFKWMMLSAFLFAGLMACGTPAPTCSPACGAGEVCIAEGGTPECKKSCAMDSDCDTGQTCHTEDGDPHCD